MLLTLPNVVRRDTMVRTSKTFVGNATPLLMRARPSLVTLEACNGLYPPFFWLPDCIVRGRDLWNDDDGDASASFAGRAPYADTAAVMAGRFDGSPGSELEGCL